MMIFFQTRMGQLLIWQKCSGTRESDFNLGPPYLQNLRKSRKNAQEQKSLISPSFLISHNYCQSFIFDGKNKH